MCESLWLGNIFLFWWLKRGVKQWVLDEIRWWVLSWEPWQCNLVVWTILMVLWGWIITEFLQHDVSDKPIKQNRPEKKFFILVKTSYLFWLVVVGILTNVNHIIGFFGVLVSPLIVGTSVHELALWMALSDTLSSMLDNQVLYIAIPQRCIIRHIHTLIFTIVHGSFGGWRTEIDDNWHLKNVDEASCPGHSLYIFHEILSIFCSFFCLALCFR